MLLVWAIDTGLCVKVYRNSCCLFLKKLHVPVLEMSTLWQDFSDEFQALSNSSLSKILPTLPRRQPSKPESTSGMESQI